MKPVQPHPKSAALERHDSSHQPSSMSTSTSDGGALQDSPSRPRYEFVVRGPRASALSPGEVLRRIWRQETTVNEHELDIQKCESGDDPRAW